MKRSTMTGLIAALTIGAVGVTSLAPAYAFGKKGDMRGPNGPRFSFEMLDADSDGKVTKEEMAEHRAAEFDARDSDDDGFLSKDELIKAAMERARQNVDRRIDRMLDRRDADKDGKISLAEMNGGKRGDRMFDRMDEDGDGAISAEEMAEMGKRFGRGKMGHGKKGHGKRWMQEQDD